MYCKCKTLKINHSKDYNSVLELIHTEYVLKINDMGSKPQIYHEKQVKELCALHALNNLFQTRNTFSQSELDSICSQLSPNVWINPHRSMLGLGNYDINVIMAALQRKGCEAVWFDKRKDPGCLDLSNICGFILNVPSDYKLGFVMLPLHRRHWIAIRQIQGNFYNLDSKLDSPQLIGRSSDLIVYLKEQLECKEKELFVVVSKEVEEKQLWINQYTSDRTEPTPINRVDPSDDNHHTMREPLDHVSNNHTSSNRLDHGRDNHHTMSDNVDPIDNNHHNSHSLEYYSNNHLTSSNRVNGTNKHHKPDWEKIDDRDYNEFLDDESY